MSNSIAVVNIVGLHDHDVITELLISEGYVVREFSSVTEFLSSGVAANTGCVVAPLSVDNNDGAVLQQRLCRDQYTIPLITIGEMPNVQSVIRTIRDGAACILTTSDPRDLLAAVDAAVRIDRYRRQWIEDYDSARERLDCLSSRQCDVLKHLVVGKLNKVIARELYLSPRTIEKHRREIHQRLGTSSLAEVVVLVERVKWPKSTVYSLPLDAFEASNSDERFLNSIGAMAD